MMSEGWLPLEPKGWPRTGEPYPLGVYRVRVEEGDAVKTPSGTEEMVLHLTRRGWRTPYGYKTDTRFVECKRIGDLPNF